MPGYIYILSNANHTVLYTGVTSDLLKRMEEHKSGKGGEFASRYNLSKLVYYEVFDDIRNAIEREKRIKGGSRQKKIELIGGLNRCWEDLSVRL